MFLLNNQTTFKPTSEAPNGKWVRPSHKRDWDQAKWKNFEVEGSSMKCRKEFQVTKQQVYGSNNNKRKIRCLVPIGEWNRGGEKQKGRPKKKMVAESSSNRPLDNLKNMEKENERVRKLFKA